MWIIPRMNSHFIFGTRSINISIDWRTSWINYSNDFVWTMLTANTWQSCDDKYRDFKRLMTGSIRWIEIVQFWFWHSFIIRMVAPPKLNHSHQKSMPKPWKRETTSHSHHQSNQNCWKIARTVQCSCSAEIYLFTLVPYYVILHKGIVGLLWSRREFLSWKRILPYSKAKSILSIWWESYSFDYGQIFLLWFFLGQIKIDYQYIYRQKKHHVYIVSSTYSYNNIHILSFSFISDYN